MGCQSPLVLFCVAFSSVLNQRDKIVLGRKTLHPKSLSLEKKLPLAKLYEISVKIISTVLPYSARKISVSFSRKMLFETSFDVHRRTDISFCVLAIE